MPIVTWVNLIGREEARLTLKGWEFYKRCMVTDLPPISPVSAQLRAAVQQLANLNIYIGASFARVFDPGVPTARCEEIIPVAEAPDTVRCDLVYREHANRPDKPSFGILSVGSSVQQATTNKDYQGNPLTLTYGGDGTKVSEQGKQTIGWDVHQESVSVLRPQTTIHLTRQESGSPGATARAYVGTVNSAPWPDTSYAPRQWLCTEISGTTRDGTIYEVTYQFQFKDPNWDETVIWIDPGYGTPPSDFLTQGGIGTFQVYQTMNFNSLLLV